MSGGSLSFWSFSVSDGGCELLLLFGVELRVMAVSLLESLMSVGCTELSLASCVSTLLVLIFSFGYGIIEVLMISLCSF